MSSHRSILLGCLIFFSIIFFCCCEIGLADPFNQLDTNGGETLTADILKKKLYAKTETEEAYCDRIIQKRNEGVLPNKILYTAYRYAVDKDKDRRFIYFQKSLEKLCADAKIELSSEKPKNNWFTMSKTQTKTPRATAATKPKTHSINSFFNFFRR